MSEGEVAELFAQLSNKSSIPKNILDKQERAWSILINRACAMPADADGNLDPEEYYIDLIESSGTAFKNWELRRFLGGIQEVIIKRNPNGLPTTAFILEKNTIWDDEKRLNKFLKRLGRALEISSRRGATKNGVRWPYEPDWEKNVDRVDSIIVQGWCEPIIFHKIRLPPLCGFTIPALHKLFQLLEPQVITSNVTFESFRKRISRLGLLCIPGRKVACVKRDANGEFRLS